METNRGGIYMTDDSEWVHLWQSCVSGDSVAAETFCLKLLPVLEARFRKLTHDPERASDRAQGFLLWLFEREQHRLKSFRPELGVPLMGYLWILTMRYHIAETRRPAAKSQDLEIGLEDVPNLPAPSEDLDRAVMNRELRAAVATLPQRERAAILWRLEGLRDGEIANLLGITSGGTAALLHRARERLRELLAGGWCDPRQDDRDGAGAGDKKS